MAVRKIVKIDEDKCTGCGECIVNCPEGALQIIDGKARLVKESYCDGLGACLGECPEGAIIIEEREADEFDEEAVAQHMAETKAQKGPLPCGCPGSAMRQMTPPEPCCEATCDAVASQLTHWPIQLRLVPPTAPFLKDADLLLVADCVPFALADFHQRFLAGGHPVVVACPKLDDPQEHVRKLKDIFAEASLRSLTIIHMEVPCCFGLTHLVEQAMKTAAVNVPVKDITISIDGTVIAEREW